MELNLQQAQGPTDISVILYINDILIGPIKKHVATVLHLVTDETISSKLTINPDKVQGLAQQVQFLGVIWARSQGGIPETIKQKL